MTEINKKDKSRGKVPNLRFTGFEGEWSRMDFSEIGTFFKGKGISKEQLSAEGNPCILYGELYTKYKSSVINEVHSRTSLETDGLVKSKANDVIIPSSGESASEIATACCVNVDDVLLGGDLNIIRPHRDNGEFISYQLNEKRKHDIAKLAQGSSVTHLYNDSLKKLKLYFPNLDEQNKISNLITKLDEKISAQSKIIGDLKSLKMIMSKRIFSQELRFKDNSANNFQNWQIKKLKDVCEILGGGTPDTNKAEYWKGNIQWFTPTEIKSNYVSKSERTISESGLKNSSAKILPEGTILLTTRATIGEASIALEECTTNQGFQSLVVKENCNNVFLFNWVKVNKYQLEKRANGSTFPEISKSAIENIEINLPSVLEQQKIADMLLSIDAKIDVEGQLLEKLEDQKKYLLANLLI